MKAKLLPILCMVLTFIACEPNEPTRQPKFDLNTTSISMYVGDSKSLDIVSDLDYSLKSNDLFVASITSNNKVKAEHVGKTSISVSNGQKTLTCEVEVLAKYHPFTEPFIPDSKGCLLNTMWNYNESHGFEFYEEASTTEYQIYKGKEPNVYFIYYFDASGYITELRMVFYDVNKYEQSIYNYTQERFKYLGIEDGVYKYCNTYNSFDATLKVTLGTYTDGTNTFVMLVYTPLAGNNINI